MAEQCVLGGMMLSKDAIADCVEALRGADFYRPAHQLVYDAILDLYGRGEPADAVTVSAELTKRGEIARVGGAHYLASLISTVPTAANAGYYARIVRDRAVLRRLVEAGTRITQMGFSADGEVDDIVDAAQAELFQVTERRSSEDYLPLSAIMEGTLDEIESIGNSGGGMTGVPTGFVGLDELTNGLHGGQMIIVAARPAVGKALALDTPVPTPTGWTTMGELAVGDEVIGADGQPTRVVAATDVLHGRPCYDVEFDDGCVIRADAEHRWLTETDSRAEVRTTATIATGLSRFPHSVRNARPLTLDERDLPLAPYVLGVWLSEDGPSRRISASDTEIVMLLEADGWDLMGSLPAEPGAPETKHIPALYLRAAEPQRRALLAGLLDVAGAVGTGGSPQFVTRNPRLAADVRELLVSLGYRCTISARRVRDANERTTATYTLTFATADVVFRLQRKQIEHKERCREGVPAKATSRSIVDVRPVPSVPVRCIQVAALDGLFLAGRSMIPTHNSTLALDFARAASIKSGRTAVIFSLEMGRNEITMRLLSAEARVSLQNIRGGTLSDDDWTRLARRMGEVSSAPLFIDDSPNMTMMEIRAKARRLKQRHDLSLVIVDYLQLMSSGKKVESRQQEVSEFSRSLKLLAKELEVPVVALSQLNRGPEQRTDKKPLMSDLRESGCLTADTRIMRADTNTEVTLAELLATDTREIPVWSLDDRLKLVPRTMTHVFPSGVKEVYRLKLASGREISATANHPFLTYDGWHALGDLAAGTRVGVLRHVPPPLQPVERGDDEIVRLADKRVVPDTIFAMPKPQVRTFLRHLWGSGGSIHWDALTNEARISFASTHRRLVDDVARLLLRFNVMATIESLGSVNRLYVDGVEQQIRFCADIGAHGTRSTKAAEVLAQLQALRPHAEPDTASDQIWDQVRATLVDSAIAQRQRSLITAGSVSMQPAPSRERMGRIAEVLGAADLEVLATNDVFWDTVVSVESLGEQTVYDATVLGTHNFVADGITVHNSLEQDADIVILLHREDLHERESPRAGEADLIVAKHRNGPCATVTVAFQGHYSRFVDMAPG
jgi:replicative DNA helicase